MEISSFNYSWLDKPNQTVPWQGDCYIKGSMISIFDYSDYRSFISDWFLAAKKKNRRFSLRAFAKNVGLSAHSYLKSLMAGTKQLSLEAAKKFACGMRLSPDEAEYFELLVRVTLETDESTRLRLKHQLNQHQEVQKMQILLQDHLEFYRQWYHPVIREMISHEGFREDPVWIASYLQPQIAPQQAQHSLELLLRLGLLERNKTGQLKPTAKNLSTGAEVSGLSEMVRSYHRSVMELAKGSLEVVPETMRDISAITFSVPAHLIPRLKNELDQFRNKIVRITSESPSGDTVVQLNLQLFPLTVGWMRQQ